MEAAAEAGNESDRERRQAHRGIKKRKTQGEARARPVDPPVPEWEPERTATPPPASASATATAAGSPAKPLPPPSERGLQQVLDERPTPLSGSDYVATLADGSAVAQEACDILRLGYAAQQKVPALVAFFEQYGRREEERLALTAAKRAAFLDERDSVPICREEVEAWAREPAGDDERPCARGTACMGHVIPPQIALDRTHIQPATLVAFRGDGRDTGGLCILCPFAAAAAQHLMLRANSVDLVGGVALTPLRVFSNLPGEWFPHDLVVQGPDGHTGLPDPVLFLRTTKLEWAVNAGGRRFLRFLYDRPLATQVFPVGPRHVHHASAGYDPPMRDGGVTWPDWQHLLPALDAGERAALFGNLLGAVSARLAAPPDDSPPAWPAAARVPPSDSPARRLADRLQALWNLVEAAQAAGNLQTAYYVALWVDCHIPAALAATGQPKGDGPLGAITVTSAWRRYPPHGVRTVVSDSSLPDFALAILRADIHHRGSAVQSPALDDDAVTRQFSPTIALWRELERKACLARCRVRALGHRIVARMEADSTGVVQAGMANLIICTLLGNYRTAAQRPPFCVRMALYARNVYSVPDWAAWKAWLTHKPPRAARPPSQGVVLFAVREAWLACVRTCPALEETYRTFPEYRTFFGVIASRCDAIRARLCGREARDHAATAATLFARLDAQLSRGCFEFTMHPEGVPFWRQVCLNLLKRDTGEVEVAPAVARGLSALFRPLPGHCVPPVLVLVYFGCSLDVLDALQTAYGLYQHNAQESTVRQATDNLPPREGAVVLHYARLITGRILMRPRPLAPATGAVQQDCALRAVLPQYWLARHTLSDLQDRPVVYVDAEYVLGTPATPRRHPVVASAVSPLRGSPLVLAHHIRSGGEARFLRDLDAPVEPLSLRGQEWFVGDGAVRTCDACLNALVLTLSTLVGDRRLCEHCRATVVSDAAAARDRAAAQAWCAVCAATAVRGKPHAARRMLDGDDGYVDVFLCERDESARVRLAHVVGVVTLAHLRENRGS